MRELSGIPTDPRPHTSFDLPAGAILSGRYEIRACLGEGGMGCVYRVLDRTLNVEIALKVLSQASIGERSALGRLRHEVTIARRVTHPNVCRVFDLGEHNELSFLTMELIEGRTLRALIAAREIDPPRAIDVLLDVAGGLGAAHEHGIIHRDLKPENVIVRPNGQAVVADFGLARDGRSAQTSGIIIAGTLAYMSPEQHRGEPLDVRSDIFALGIVGFELLSGRSPFGDGAPTTIAAAILRDPPRPLEIPGLLALEVQALEHVLSRAMAKQPADRFATAADFAATLRAARPGAPSIATPEALPPPASRYGCLPRAATVLLVFAALAIVVLAVRSYRVVHEPPAVSSSSAAPREVPALRADARPAVVVANFENRSGDPTQERLCQSAADAVRAGLRTLQQIRLIDVPEGGDPDAIARREGAAWLAIGSAQRVGAGLRLAAQLKSIDGSEPGEPIEIDGAEDDPAKLVERFRDATIDEVRLLSKIHDRRRRAEEGTKNAEARSKLLKYYETSGATPGEEQVKAGKQLLDEAILVDPAYVPALIERAYLATQIASDPSRFDAALADLAQALSLEPRSALALAMRCRVLRGKAEGGGDPTDADLSVATDACKSAFTADPSAAHVHIAFAGLYDRACKEDQAMESLEQALSLDRSLSGRILPQLVGLALQNGRMTIADRRSQELAAFQDDEQRRGAHSLGRRAGQPKVKGAHVLRASVLMRLGKLNEARTALERVLSEDVQSGSDMWEAAAIRGLIQIAAKQGSHVPPDLERRLQVIEQGYRDAPSKGYELARVYQWTDPSASIRWLDQLPAPVTLKVTFERALFYHAAGDDIAARRLLDGHTLTQAWERGCGKWLGARLSR